MPRHAPTDATQGDADVGQYRLAVPSRPGAEGFHGFPQAKGLGIDRRTHTQTEQTARTQHALKHEDTSRRCSFGQTFVESYVIILDGMLFQNDEKHGLNIIKEG